MRYTTRRHRAGRSSKEIDRAALPRVLKQCARLRGRKVIPYDPLHFLHSVKNTEDHQFVRAPPKPVPYPMLPSRPFADPASWRSLPETLTEPTIGEIDADRVYALQPEYKGIPVPYIRSEWPYLYHKPLGVFQKLLVACPKSLLPNEYHMLIKDVGLASRHTHFFAVYMHAPSSDTKNSRTILDQREAELYPVHGAIWAAHATRLPAFEPKALSDITMKTVRMEAGKDAVTLLRLPVVPIALPYPPMFWPLHSFVYTQHMGLFVRQVYLLDTEASWNGFVFADRLGREWAKILVVSLLRKYDMEGLCKVAKNCYGVYQNMIALGMVSQKLWRSLHYTWYTLRRAMLACERGGVDPYANEANGPDSFLTGDP